MKNKSSEFDVFDSAMRELMKVPHNEIKAKLDAEKKKKKQMKEKHDNKNSHND